ncbi:MAG: alpha/beta fold hydrolase, partial [Pseudomonadota bacterium]
QNLTETEAKIADICHTIIGTKPDKNSNIFNQGADSIKAIRLVDAIRRTFPDRQLSLADLFNGPSIQQLALRIEQEDHEDLAVVHLHKGGAQSPLFLFPGLMVNTREYTPLARHLERQGQGDRTISGFVCYSLNQNGGQTQTVESIAASYADYIRKHARGQACTFLGWSWGGVLAYEAARQLGEDVDLQFVGMLDVCDLDVNFATGTLVQTNPLQEKALSERVADWLPHTKMRPQWEALFRKMDKDLFRQFLRYVQTAGGQLPTDGPNIGSKEYELWTYLDNTLVYRQHITIPADIPIHVWRAEDSLTRKLQLVDWTRYSPRVERIETIPGVTHRQIVDSADFHRSFAQSLSGAWTQEFEDA